MRAALVLFAVALITAIPSATVGAEPFAVADPAIIDEAGGSCLPCGGDCLACGGRRTIWVDQASGDDDNSGLSREEALRTIGRGAELIGGGDVMIVRP
ncbi:MAG: hypothetical protein AAF543_24255, partial [Pseudomonadota bacterium]